MTFKKGRSANPGGQHRRREFREALRIELNETKGDLKRIRRIAAALVKEAEGGNIVAIREIADRIDGKPEANLNVSTDNQSDPQSEPVSETAAWIEESFGAAAHIPPKDTLPN